MTAYAQHFEVTWHDGGREPVCPPDPDYPHGMDMDFSDGATPTCTVALLYPAKRCGLYAIICKRCGFRLGVTTAGRPDDPRSVTVACKRKYDA